MIPYTTNAQGWLEIKFGSMTMTEGYAPSAYAPYGSVAIASQGKNACRAILNWSSSSANGNALFVMADLRPNTTYTLSFVGAVGHKVYTNGSIVEQQSSITCTGERQDVTFTTKDTLPETQNPYGWLLLRNSSGNTVMPAFSDVQLEVGDTATPYQPYEGDTYPIDLQGNSLRSLPDGTRDGLRVGERKVLGKRVGSAVFDGSSDENWHVESLGVTGSNFYIAVSDAARGTYGDRIMLTLCQACTRNFAQKDRGFISDSGNLNLTVGGTLGISTVADFRTWLATNPVTAIYPLATPQEIDLGAVSDMPFIPEDGEMWVDGTTMEAVLRPADYAGQPTIQSVDVQRVNADGTAWTVATGLTVGGSCIDPLPPLGVPVEYRIVASAASGATVTASFTETFGGRDWALNFGNGAQESIMFRYNPQASYSMEHGGEAYHFADGGAGGGRPVFYPTTDRDESGSLKFDTIGKDDADRLRALCDRYPVAWLRDPFGHRWRAQVKPSWSHGVGQLWPLGIDWDAVRWTEAWDG